jgi:hypothetical protein
VSRLRRTAPRAGRGSAALRMEPARLRTVIAGGVAAIVVAGLAGWLLGGVLVPDTPPAPVRASAQVAVLGPMRVALDGNWTTQAPGRDQLAMRLGDLAVFAPTPGLSGRSWVARAAADHPSLVPAGVRARLAQAPPKPTTVRLAGSPAWRYDALRLRSGSLLGLTVLPTAAGVVLVGCEGTPGSWGAVSGCEQGVGVMSGAAVLAPAADLAFRQRIPAVLAKLNAARAGAGRALAAARRARGQARAAAQLAQAHATAAAKLRPLVVAGTPAGRVVRRLNEAAGAYRNVAGAANRRAPRRYAAARGRATKAGAALRTALRQATA